MVVWKEGEQKIRQNVVIARDIRKLERGLCSMLAPFSIMEYEESFDIFFPVSTFVLFQQSNCFQGRQAGQDRRYAGGDCPESRGFDYGPFP